MQYLDVWGFIGIALSIIVAFGIAHLASSRTNVGVDQARLGSLDGLRGFLALGVLIAHFPLAWNLAATGTWSADADPVFATCGMNAVALFFMTTSFLFFGKIRRSRAIDWTQLYWRRLLRLYPMYLVAIGVMVLISFGHHELRLVVPIRELAISLFKWLTFTLISPATVNNYPHSPFVLSGVIWTLRYEWLFYALLPGVAFAVRRVGERSWMLPAVLLVAACLCAIAPDWRFRDFGARPFGPFLIGMIASELLRRDPLRRLLRTGASPAMALAGLVGLFLLDPKPYGLLHLACLFLLFVPIVAGYDFGGLLVRREWRLLGDSSYSFYLLHGIGLHLFFWAMPPPSVAYFGPMMAVVLPLLSATISALSIATYVFVEKPFIAVGYTPRLRKHVPATAEVM